MVGSYDCTFKYQLFFLGGDFKTQPPVDRRFRPVQRFLFFFLFWTMATARNRTEPWVKFWSRHLLIILTSWQIRRTGTPLPFCSIISNINTNLGGNFSYHKDSKVGKMITMTNGSLIGTINKLTASLRPISDAKIPKYTYRVIARNLFGI